MTAATCRWISFLAIFSSMLSQLVTLNISLIIENYNAVCGGDSICNSEHFDKNTEFVLKYGSYCPTCSCNISCITNGNCCPEMFFSLQPTCVDTYILQKKSDKKNKKFVLMLDKCPNDVDKKMRNLCKPKSNTPEHQLTNIPVTSTRNNVTYRNVHCARCHNETDYTVRPWKIEMKCDRFADFNFLSSYKEIINLAIKQKCSIFYSSDSEVKLRKCNENPDVESGLIDKCNISGTWDSYNKDIDSACSTYDNPYSVFRNVFCFICNPPSQNAPVISQCNSTSKWDIYDREIETACARTLLSKVTIPFKNVFCYLCNRNNTAAVIDGPFTDANISYSINKSEHDHFMYNFTIESYNIMHITDFHGRRIENKKELFRKMNVGSLKTIKVKDNTLNLTNIYLQYYAYTGNADFCPNNSLFDEYGSRCSCDENCLFSKQRCCVDVMFDRSTLCTKRNLSHDNKRYLIYNSCKNNNDLRLSRLCADDDDNALFSFLPVEIELYDGSTLHFKNIFCLACNNQINKLDAAIFWKVNMSCDKYIPPTYHLTFEEYFNFVRTQRCGFNFSPPISGILCVDEKFSECNESGFWNSYDSDIDYACNKLNFPETWFSEGNPFCHICNPTTKDEPTIKTCNETGLWKISDQDVENNCLSMPVIRNYVPYKNIFCKLCNTMMSFPSLPWEEQTLSDSIKRLVIIHHSETNSFRAIFSLSSYVDQKEEENFESKCNITQIYDPVKNGCRDMFCYPGRVLIGNACMPLLPTTINLGYVLALRLKTDLMSEYNNTEMFLNTFHHEFQTFLTNYLGIMFLEYELSYLYTSLRCSKSEVWKEKTTIEIFIYEKFFISDYVNRSLIENQLIDIVNMKFNFSYKNSFNEFTIYPESKSFNLAQLLFKLDFTHHCFIKATRKNQLAKMYKHSYVTELLACNQIELSAHEFEIDLQNLKLTFTMNGKHIENHEYILTSFKRAKICINTFEKINRSLKHGKTDNNAWGILIMICAYISLICLILTFVTYVLFPSLRSLPGKNNMCLVFSMFCAHSLFYFGLNQTDSEIGCNIIGIWAHYFWLATFGCLNICSFHMFRVFRSKTLLTLQGDRTNKLFVKYVIYSFGTPLVIVTLNGIVTVIAEGSFSYGGRMCFLNQFIAVIVTFILPITLVCLSNIFFFVVTSVKIAKTPKVEMDSQQSRSNQVHFVVYLKLFTITGISWIFQILDSFLPQSEFSTIVSVMNSLQGVFIFFSYICNKRVLNLFKTLRKRSGEMSGSSSQYKASVNSTSL